MPDHTYLIPIKLITITFLHSKILLIIFFFILQVTPPLAFFERLNEIGNISDFLNEFIEEGSMDPRDFIESKFIFFFRKFKIYFFWKKNLKSGKYYNKEYLNLIKLQNNKKKIKFEKETKIVLNTGDS